MITKEQIEELIKDADNIEYDVPDNRLVFHWVRIIAYLIFFYIQAKGLWQ